MKRPSAGVRRAAFTLTELLTVIAILAILMALLFPAIIMAREHARRAKAKEQCLNIVQSVEAFHTEYGLYPKLDPSATPSAGEAPDESAGDPAAQMTIHNSALFNTLRAIDRAPNANNAQNPKRQPFFATSIVGNPAKPKDGFLDTSGSATGNQGSLYDPWGTEYNIVIDANGDNVIETRYEDFSGENAPRVPVGVFSLGKDKLPGRNGNWKFREGADLSDDRASWMSN
jgi:prepilin-type N-terminal cleavage/methylation domain-containing protein